MRDDLLLAVAGAFAGGLDVDDGVGEVAGGAVEPVLRGVEDVPVALLNRDGELLLGGALEFGELGHLVVGEVLHLVGAAQLAQCNPAQHLDAHVVDASAVGNDEDEVVAVVSEVGAGALVAVDLLDQRLDAHCVARDAGGFEAEHHEVRAAAAVVVRHVVRA